MKKMGFRDKWCKWVDSCLRSASMSILVNGSPSEEFRLKRGIRQGDPLSHFLFILAAEGLNALVSEAVEKGIFRGVAVGEDNVTVSHLQYADDTIFFEEWNKENAKSLMCILKCFEEDSGLRVNYNKSKIYGIGVNEGEMSDMARWMRCEIGEFPFTYLGLPIRENMKRVNAWYPVVEKFKKRLASWKTKTMSFAGRLTLVKSVLGSLQLYYFLIFRVPLNVIKNLERIRKNFFWGELGAGKKLSWVKWDSILLFVRGRGLNVGSLRAKNLPLLGQWKGVSRDGVWGNIVKIGEEIDGLGVEFASSCVGILGDGRDIRRKETSVMDKGGWVNNSWVWKWDRDRWRWSLGEDGEFKVKELSRMIEEKILLLDIGGQEMLWNKLVPKKVNIFVWRALKGRLPVRVELDKKGVDLDSVLCAGLCWVGCAIIRDSSVICLQVQCMFRFTGDIFSLVGLLHSNVNVGFQIVLVPFLLLFYVSDVSFWIVG
ncbi:reverse transcriptase domain, reverse transcriptase zinc-binding domain protein [Tanacetum coccineum]